MIVERLWMGNELRNYNYLIACPDSGEALAIDPFDHQQILQTVKEKGWNITQVLNTHEHHDHIGGNADVIAATGAKLIAHHKAGSKIPGVDRGVAAGDIIKVGRHIELECLDTPGHTLCHICLLSHTDQPALFSGDTLFNAGAGNVFRGGCINALFDTFQQQLMKLPDNTQLYPGHDYLKTNIQFTLSVEPNNTAAQTMLSRHGNDAPTHMPITTMAQEKTFNTFMRLQTSELIASMQAEFPELIDKPEPKTIFQRLRERRNTW